VLTARDLAASRDFYCEVIGLVVSDETPDTLHLRGVEERAHHSLTLKKTTGQPQCERVGFRVYSDEDLDRAQAHFKREGRPCAFVEVPYQGRTLQVSDDAGTPLEFCATMEPRPRLHTRTDLHEGGRGQRMDHYQVLVPDLLPAAKFYTDLGFRVSDYIVVEGAERVVATFLHRKNNPWDMVLMMRGGPRFHHCGIVVESVADRSAPAMSPAMSASPTRSSTAPAGMGTAIRTTSICAIPTATAPNCCCRQSSSWTATRSRSAAP
jgi:catechol 2,3-dioxygenase